MLSIHEDKSIDWRRVGVPQVDGYDTDVIVRGSVEGRYAGKEVVATEGEILWPPGRARLVSTTGKHAHPSPDYRILSVDDSIMRSGLALLKLWPEIEAQCGRVLHALCPMTAEHRESSRGHGHGCSCGHFGDDFGWIYVTADDAWGFAEGIVHEMGHWKLRALGMWFEDWTSLILDHKFEETYASPVRKDKPRPMGAVLHAQYSYIHVARMSTLALQATAKPGRQDIDWAALQLTRITEGQRTLRAHARGTAHAGREFLAGIDDWTTQVLQEGQAIVDAARALMAQQEAVRG